MSDLDRLLDLEYHHHIGVLNDETEYESLKAKIESQLEIIPKLGDEIGRYLEAVFQILILGNRTIDQREQITTLTNEKKQLEFNLKNAQEIIKTQENWIEELNHLFSEIEELQSNIESAPEMIGKDVEYIKIQIKQILQKYKESK